MNKKTTIKKRLNTRLQAEGAEFLVLGNLLVEGIDAYKSYRYMQGYDVVAVLPEQSRTARIQVKSRYATDAIGFLVKNYECDFVVFAKLNREFTFKKNWTPTQRKQGRRPPECYVLPRDVVWRNRDKKSRLGRVVLERIPAYETYKDRWELVRNFLRESES